jgi:hypothetical protein
MEVLLGLPPLHVMIRVEAQAGIYRLMCSQQWRPKFTNFCHARTFRDMEHEPILQMGTDMMIPRYAYRKPFTVNFSDKCGWQNRFRPLIKGGLVWYTDESETNEGTAAGVYRWGSRRGRNFSLGLKYMPLHSTLWL